MEQTHFRAAIIVMLAITLAAGLYLGWHFTHQSHRCSRWNPGQADCSHY